MFGSQEMRSRVQGVGGVQGSYAGLIYDNCVLLSTVAHTGTLSSWVAEAERLS